MAAFSLLASGCLQPVPAPAPSAAPSSECVLATCLAHPGDPVVQELQAEWGVEFVAIAKANGTIEPGTLSVEPGLAAWKADAPGAPGGPPSAKVSEAYDSATGRLASIGN